MPERITKVDGYRVSTPGGVKAKHTTKKKAMAQARLLRAVEHGWKPTGKPAVESSHYASKDGASQRDEFHKRKRK